MKARYPLVEANLGIPEESSSRTQGRVLDDALFSGSMYPTTLPMAMIKVKFIRLDPSHYCDLFFSAFGGIAFLFHSCMFGLFCLLMPIREVETRIVYVPDYPSTSNRIIEGSLRLSHPRPIAFAIATVATQNNKADQTGS
ncbi:unnamed protein product [Cylicocyclus nassatus]|uniref:Uncharacterized protein n=1 Tax=Cylicocyclus nassatus TaxID=53992 RepID=A0AA36H2Z8_CYLNA|nr:unnamed protein product [Cylicocyclus nassatus]